MNPHIHNGLLIESIESNDFEFAGSGNLQVLSDEEAWEYYKVPITEDYLIQQIKHLEALQILHKIQHVLN